MLIVAETGDDTARAVAAAAARGSGATTALFVPAARLALANWTHRITPEGRGHTVVSLPDAVLDDASLGAVWFRSPSFSHPGFHGSPSADRDYARAEVHALVVSWLRSLGDRVVNAVDGGGCCGPSRGPLRWLVEALRIGLPVLASVIATSARLVPAWHGSPWQMRRPFETPPTLPEQRVLVVGHHAFGRLAAPFGPACLRLAKAAGCRILQVGFVNSEGSWRVCSVDPLATIFEPEEVGAVAALLSALAARSARKAVAR